MTKTLAIRLDDSQHAQLSMLAQLLETTVTDVIRSAITERIQTMSSNPLVAERAEAVMAKIDAEAATRRDAIAEMFKAADGGDPPPAKPAGRTRKAAGSS